MMGLHFMGEVPFRTVYIHALVRDEFGQKMSKSKGNIIDPLETIEKYGCDALRFTLVALAAQGRDIKLAESRVEGYRNFATKLWNATRFCQMNGCELDPDFVPERVGQKINRWIIGRLVQTSRRVEAALDDYRFNEAAHALYHFVWHEFCDWYLEFTKPVLGGDDPAAAKETRAATAWVLNQVLHLMHPVMPFITEELWQQTGGAAAARTAFLMSAAWPGYDDGLIDETAIAEIDWVIRLVSEIRAVRTEMNVPPSAQIPAELHDAGQMTRRHLADYRELVLRLARLSGIEAIDGPVAKGAAQIVVDEATVALPLAGVIDIGQERGRLSKELEKAKGEVTKLEKKLGNEQFVAKAPPEVVEEQRQRLTEATLARNKLAGALERLAGL